MELVLRQCRSKHKQKNKFPTTESMRTHGHPLEQAPPKTEKPSVCFSRGSPSGLQHLSHLRGGGRGQGRRGNRRHRGQGAGGFSRGSDCVERAEELEESLHYFPPQVTQWVATMNCGRRTLGSKGLHIFNLTSLTKSENILSATLYFYIGELRNISPSCPVSQGCSHHPPRKHIQIDLSAWVLQSNRNQSQLLGRLSITVARPHRDGMSWLSKDITQFLRKAKENEEFLVGFNITCRGHLLLKGMPPFPEPYILVYANDAAISEPESVVSSLQGHQNFPTGALPQLDSHIRAALSIQGRKKRSTGVLLPLQNNELPGAEYQYKEDGVWEERKPYKTLQTQPPEKSKTKKKQRKGPHQKSQTLQFDEQTLKKARRKQWIEPRNCARRYLKVDFADIGWSEWIISPKSFDAYYCSGACQFPMPKSLKPSNHATIQSIVRAVGVVPGIPEPCCVPEKMSSLSILFFDENKNVVLKVYPNMTVESCACR
ncbi:bone morphogenetic protein 3 [Echinops telfairi]|uniref:Bone morphogenetic protein 3 n=1 Tax=Echinops telfairi TaxID=9371 RepID=A0ABM0IM77_ECHTE|nr:bone morphogenetic protein 3 [Echinops telfairi]